MACGGGGAALGRSDETSEPGVGWKNGPVGLPATYTRMSKAFRRALAGFIGVFCGGGSTWGAAVGGSRLGARCARLTRIVSDFLP